MICPVCKKEFTPSKYHKKQKTCSRKCCIKLWQVTYGNENRRKYIRNIKKQVFELLGNKCVVCGYQGSALQVDHINGGGLKEIRKVRTCSYAYWKYLLNKIQSGSKEYQLLCANHNWEKYYDEKE